MPARTTRHIFSSAIADSSDNTLIRPQADWDANHIVGESMLNSTGVSLNPGDVVGLDPAVNGSVVLADTQSVQRPLYVVIGAVSGRSLVAIGNGITGYMTTLGGANVNVTGAVTRGNWLRKSATTKLAEDTGVASTSPPPLGAFAVALDSIAGTGTISALLFGQTFSGLPSTSIVGTANQVNVAFASGVFTLSTPQNIHTGASPTFVAVQHSGYTTAGLPAAGTAGRLTRVTDGTEGWRFDFGGVAWARLLPWVSSLELSTIASAISALGSTVGVVLVEPAYGAAVPTSGFVWNAPIHDLRSPVSGYGYTVSKPSELWVHTFDHTNGKFVGRFDVATFANATINSDFFTMHNVKFGDSGNSVPVGTKGVLAAYEANFDTSQAAADGSENCHAFGATMVARGGLGLSGLAATLTANTVACDLIGGNVALTSNVAGATPDFLRFTIGAGTQNLRNVMLVQQAGAATIDNGLVFNNGTITSGNPVFVAPNNNPYRQYDTGGVSRTMLNLNASNQATFGTTAYICVLTGTSFALQTVPATPLTGSLYLGAGVTAAGLGTPTNGTIVYCTDCTLANPCAGGGSGALAKRLNGVWVCN